MSAAGLPQNADAAPQMDPKLAEEIAREMSKNEKAQAYINSLPSISVKTSGNNEGAGVAMDERLRLVLQEEQELKQVGKMTEA